MGNPVSISSHNSAVSLSSQVSSSLHEKYSARPYCGFHRTVAHKRSYNSISVIPSKVLRPYICSAEDDVCRNLFISKTAQAPSVRSVIGSKGFSSRGRFMTKSQNGNTKNEDDAREAAFQVNIEQSTKVLALQKQLLEKIAERRKLVLTLKNNHGNSADKTKIFTENFGLQEDQRSNNTEKHTDMQNVRIEETHLDNIQETPRSSTVKAAKFLPNDCAFSNLIPKDWDVGVLVEEKKAEEKYVKAHKGNHSGPEEAKCPPLAGSNVMNIIMVGAECVPWSKTGGLGDVVGALPKALARRGHRVMAIAPRYSDYNEAWDTGVRRSYNVAGEDMEVGYFHAYIDGVDHIFIDNPIFHIFKDNIYGGSQRDSLTRTILFCKAAIEVPWYVRCGGACYGDGNLFFVANDWHTALLPVFLKAYYHDCGLMKYTRCVLVIHNIAHQGRGPLGDFGLLTLPDHYLEKFMLDDAIGGPHLNIFMAGLKTAHRLVAVSHGYAWECQTQEGGWGLHDVVKENSWKLRGIVNGIDNKEWNPQFDVHLKSDGYVNYSLNTLEYGKAICKSALQRELGLPVRSDVPLIGFIGRLVTQKGVDLIAEAMPWMVEQDLQLVMLGTGRKDIENMLHSFEAQYHDKVRGWVGFSVRTSHCIIAGADILLMPSIFEPCGLNQLYAMQYGTIPVVHAVGGLRDTVKPFNPFADSGVGWTFEPAEASALIDALRNALWTYRDFKQSWIALQKRCMHQDLSWDNAAQQYEEVLLAAKYQW